MTRQTAPQRLLATSALVGLLLTVGTAGAGGQTPVTTGLPFEATGHRPGPDALYLDPACRQRESTRSTTCSRQPTT